MSGSSKERHRFAEVTGLRPVNSNWDAKSARHDFYRNLRPMIKETLAWTGRRWREPWRLGVWVEVVFLSTEDNEEDLDK